MSVVHLPFIGVHYASIKVLNFILCFIKQGDVLEIMIKNLMIRNIRVHNALG